MNEYLERTVYNAPDPAKMEEAIASIDLKEPGILVILFAYYAGLSDSEMLEVKGSDLSEDFSFLVAPDQRKIPIAPILADELKKISWIRQHPYLPVLLSKRGRMPGAAMSRMQVNRVLKEFMSFAGIPDVRLRDLRTACIVRWMQQYPWEYVSQISGVELRALIQRYQHYLPEDIVRPKLSPKNHTKITPDLIESILQKHNGDLFGLMFRLSVVHRVPRFDICNLTWDMVDDEKNIIRFPPKDVPITDDLRRCLDVAKAYSNAKWVLAYPNTKTPYTSDAISRFMSKTLLADGYIGLTASDFLQAEKYRYKEIVKDLLTKANCFFVEDFTTASGLTVRSARKKLHEMEMEGLITQIGRRIYSAEKTIHPSKFAEVAQRLTETNGGYFTSNQFADAVGIDGRSACTQLRKMIGEGKVERVSTVRYTYKPNTDHK